MERKLYDSVRDYLSSNPDAKIKAYAAKNIHEYFAELSRIYFLVNNRYTPRDRDEMAKHDPVGFALMQQVWGRLPTIAEEGAALRRNGTDLIRRGNYQGAVDDLTRALERTPNDYLVWHERAVAYTYLKKDAEAIADYGKSIRLNNTVPTAYRGRGSALLRQGKPAEAMSDFDRALQLKPDYVLAYRGRAAAYRELGMKDEADRDEQSAKRLEQGPPKTP
jgi:Flp pilus assembly protein TadD